MKMVQLSHVGVTFVYALFARGLVDGFFLSSQRDAIIHRRGGPKLKATEGEDKVAALLAAAEKARAEADQLRQELASKSGQVATEEEFTSKQSKRDLTGVLPGLLAESDLVKQSGAWRQLKESNSLKTFASANLRSYPVTLKMLEQRTGLTPERLGMTDGVVNLDDFKFATLWVTGGCSVLGILSLATLPPNVGATVCYLLALVPVLFLGIGSTSPALIANAIAALKGKAVASESSASASRKERIVRHEAAHFCCGYWCGLPIAGYSVDEGVARVEFAVGTRAYSNTEIAALAVTALSGLVAEASAYDKVLPGTGTADLLQLEQVFRRAEEFIGAEKQQDLTRWGALTATLLLRQNSRAYEKVVEAFTRMAPLEECIAILEE